MCLYVFIMILYVSFVVVLIFPSVTDKKYGTAGIRHEFSNWTLYEIIYVALY